MAEEAKKPKKTEGSNNKLTIAFFAVIIVGLIVVTIIFFTKNSSKDSRIFTASYGERFNFLLEVFSNNKVDLAIDMAFDEDSDGKYDRVDRTMQSGISEKIDPTFEGEERYQITFKDEPTPDSSSGNTTTETTVTNEANEINAIISINGNVLTLIYEDGIEIPFEEIEKNE